MILLGSKFKKYGLDLFSNHTVDCILCVYVEVTLVISLANHIASWLRFYPYQKK